MEIMYANKLNNNFKKKSINGFYKDKNDLINYLPEFYGLSYDDEWSVKRFLNGLKLKFNEKILEVFKSLGLHEDLLNKKIKILSTNEFKMVLLAHLIIEDPEVYIFDYFEVGLSFRNRKMFVNLLKSLKSEGKTIIVITNNIGFLYEISDNIMVVEERKMIYNGGKNDLFVARRIKEYPPIIDFIRKANKKDANLLYTMDRKELLKDIYRSLR